MACIENIPPTNGDSEMEEGEIIDELDDLSDISSEEEFLLRQRLQVLENYNNVLERKKAKSNSTGKSGKKEKYVDLLPQDLSEISASDNEENFPKITVNRNNNERYIKQKRKKLPVVLHLGNNRDNKKKSHRVKKKIPPKVVAESSEESEDDYRNKRRKLANAVVVHTPKSDTTSLRARLKKMFGTQSQEPINIVVQEKPKLELNTILTIDSSTNSDNVEIMNTMQIEKPLPEEMFVGNTKICELIDLCEEEGDNTIHDAHAIDTVDGDIQTNNVAPAKESSSDSDEDLELLRQHALKTKTSKSQKTAPPDIKELPENKPTNDNSEDEDSDTAELRLICLKSALLKKAIEMKQKQKLRKRLSQSIHEDHMVEDAKETRKSEVENNTDIESVDMDIGSEGEEKIKDTADQRDLVENEIGQSELGTEFNVLKNIPIPNSPHKDEVDEDEDLLRAKLLTSLSKNWPNLVDHTVMETTEVPTTEQPASTAKSKSNLPVEKPFIIRLGESDSEGEHEATKNLTKMHLKLAEQTDFQEKLDMFLKSTRMEVEKKSLPDVVQKPLEQPKPAPKYVAKTVRHLPKSEQIEYKNLVKRMAELEKIKLARQTSMNLNVNAAPVKDTLKPRNVSSDTPNNIAVNNLEEHIAVSRKKIAEESAKMLKLKEEATKLSQKYKIVATELRNISTAITLNKKEQKSVQSRLTKIRLQHQTLIKSSTSNKHSITNMPLVMRNSTKNLSSTKLQKENDPSKEEYKNLQLLKSVKVSVVNDLKDESVTNPRLSVQVDVSNNTKIVKMPKSPTKERVVDFTKVVNRTENFLEAKNPIIEKEGGRGNTKTEGNKSSEENKDIDDYKSPLEALHSGNWEEDPNSFLCPFEVGGSCKDPDCKYLHPKIPTNQ